MESFKLISYHILLHILILISFFYSTSCDPQSLDTIIYNYVNNKISSIPSAPRTGVIHNLKLPSINSSTIQLSVVRLRSGSLWARGQNISAFQMPPMIIPTPYVKRLVLVTSNLGNLSSYYFTAPQGYVFASPIVGLAIYNASTTAFLGNMSININAAGEPLIITFNKSISNYDAMCVSYDKDGVEGEVLGIMSKPGQCSVYKQGYFTIAVRVANQVSSSNNPKLSKGWVVGVVIGVGVFLLMSCVGIMVWRMVRRKRIKEMERQSEKEVGVGTMWVGHSRLPKGNMCRTQPQLETEMLP